MTGLRNKLFGFVLIFLFCTCKKREENPQAPIISLINVSELTVEEFNNTVVINISYEDYQGDIGENDPDKNSLRVRDSRLSDDNWYHLPPMTPDMKNLHIKGTYSIELDPLFLLGIGTQEDAKFSIGLKDRNGNWSNTVTTPNVLIVDSL